jgi:hypothetical protein
MRSDTTPEAMFVEFSVPENFGILYLETALKIGLKSLQDSRHFIEMSGNTDANMYMREAEESMDVLIQCVDECKVSIFEALSHSRSSQISDLSEFPAGYAGSIDVVEED